MAGIYVHIPFCRQACTYCNFHFSTSLRGRDDFLRALEAEIALRKDALGGVAVRTVYFGGGTPSLLSPAEIRAILETLARTFGFTSLEECTLEANPDDLSPAYLRDLRAVGLINRLSIGVQSFRDEDLRYTHRAHTATQAVAGIKAAQDAGFSDLSIDLIYGIPGLSDNAWRAALDTAEALRVPHLSAYALTVEEGTALHHAIEKKGAAPVDPEASARHFEILQDWAVAAGYEHYEISNLAKPGCYARHNTAYWSGAPYLGLGPSAHSFDGAATRRWNVANNALYSAALLRGAESPFEEETLSSTDRLNEYLMTSLRTHWGCDLSKIEKDWSTEYAATLRKKAAPAVARGVAVQRDKTLVLTRVGRLFADGVAAELFF